MKYDCAIDYTHWAELPFQDWFKSLITNSIIYYFIWLWLRQLLDNAMKRGCLFKPYSALLQDDRAQYNTSSNMTETGW